MIRNQHEDKFEEAVHYMVEVAAEGVEARGCVRKLVSNMNSLKDL